MNPGNNVAVAVKKNPVVQTSQSLEQSVFVKMSKNFDKMKNGQDKQDNTTHRAEVAFRRSGVYAY